MILCSTDSIAGHDIVTTLGLVRGAATRTRSLFQDLAEWLRNLVGAELDHYTKMLAEAREQAIDRMLAEARTLGADAVVGLRLTTNHVAKGAAEVLAYGTAVKLVRRG